ncbi:MAG TPA: hypothetical protein VGF95_14545 [Solirubrobacteraceae bacterium]
MLAERPALLLGSQTPRIFTAPAFARSTGPEVIDLARMAGLDLDPWQRQHLTAALGESSPGRWAALEVGEVAPRQNGKNGELEARQLGGLFTLEEPLQIHSAHMADTSVEQCLRLEGLIEGCPDLSRRVKGIKHGKGDECIQLHRNPRTGVAPRLRFRTRTGGGGRGFSCDTLYLDEAMILPEAFHGTLMPVLSARPNAQLWYTGSAVDQEIHEHGMVLARLRVRGIAGDESLVYLEYSLAVETPDDVTPEMAADPENWARTNPALGTRIKAEYVANEQKSMSARSFAVERLGVGDWPDTSEDAGRVISDVEWKALACRDENMRPDGPRTFALDANPDRTWGSIGVCSLRPDDLWQIALVVRRRTTSWMVARCKELDREFAGARFALDVKGPASNLIDSLKSEDLDVIELDAADYGQAWKDFYDGVIDGTIRYPWPQPELDAAVADARKARLGDSWKWDRRSPTSADITPLVACTLALWGAKTPIGIPQVWDLNEIAGHLHKDIRVEPSRAEPDEQAGFVPLEIPGGRGVFRP